MAILETEIEVLVQGKNVKPYENLGIFIPRRIGRNGKLVTPRGTKIRVKIDQLSEGSSEKVTKICDDCGKHTTNQRYGHIMRSRRITDGLDRCQDCGKKYASKSQIENVYYENSIEHEAILRGFLYLLDEYSENNLKTAQEISYGSAHDVLWICRKCNLDYLDSPHDRFKGVNCPYCVGKRVSIHNSLATLFPCVSKEWHPSLNGVLMPSDFTSKSNTYAWWVCNKCNHQWEALISSRTSGRNCPKCKESRGEKVIGEFLIKNNIMHIPQFCLEDCKYRRRLPFDFAIFDSNNSLLALIEFQGQLHYFSVEYFGGDKAFELTAKRDKIKYDYCLSNNIPLICIPYWDYIHIEEILTFELIKLNIDIAM